MKTHFEAFDKTMFGSQGDIGSMVKILKQIEYDSRSTLHFWSVYGKDTQNFRCEMTIKGKKHTLEGVSFERHGWMYSIADLKEGAMKEVAW